MNRRKFLKLLGFGAIAAVVPGCDQPEPVQRTQEAVEWDKLHVRLGDMDFEADEVISTEVNWKGWDRFPDCKVDIQLHTTCQQ